MHDLVQDSPLCGADPRAKLAVSVCASLAVMLPLPRLAIFVLIYVFFLLWARLLRSAIEQIWRIKWVIVALFVVDWLVIGLDLAVVVTLRLFLLGGVLALFVSTTTPDELRLALEKLRVPYRYAFSLSLAFQSTAILEREWRAIHEAQLSRGAFSAKKGLRRVLLGFRDWVSLTVPAIVLTTHRAWAVTEAACARGFDAPHRRPYRQLRMRWTDWALGVAAVTLLTTIALW
jgi:energy-coupling factor transport system permease protein